MARQAGKLSASSAGGMNGREGPDMPGAVAAGITWGCSPMLHLLTGLTLRSPSVGAQTSPHRHVGKTPGSPEPDQWAQMIARGKARRTASQEPNLEDLLDDPVVRRMMLSDRVDPSDIRRAMEKKEG